MTKGLSRKQIIILMSSKNTMKFMKNSSLYVTNINKLLRNVKLEVLVKFIQLDQMVIIVITSKVVLQLDLLIIENYIKDMDNIDSLSIEVSWLLQSKSYLKIIGIPYFSHDKSQECLSSSNIVTNFIQLVSPQLVDQFSQTKLYWKAPNESYPYMCGIYKSDNKWLRYQAISSCKSFVC